MLCNKLTPQVVCSCSSNAQALLKQNVLIAAKLHASDKARYDLRQTYACRKKTIFVCQYIKKRRGQRNFVVAKCEGRRKNIKNQNQFSVFLTQKIRNSAFASKILSITKDRHIKLCFVLSCSVFLNNNQIIIGQCRIKLNLNTSY